MVAGKAGAIGPFLWQFSAISANQAYTHPDRMVK
jgi:hypothetical protein